MKIKRLFITSITALCLLTSCNLSTEESSKDSGKTRLNIAQSNLIAEFTGNEKYLNKDLLVDIKTLDDNDQVGVIVTLDKKGVLDSYQKNSKGCDSFTEYTEKGYGDYEASGMLKEQDRLIARLKREGLIEESKHSYTALMNGFSAETTYGNYKKLLDMGLASEVSLSEVYALPQTVKVETDSDVVENETGVHEETGIFDSSEAAQMGYTGANTAVAVLDSGFDVHHQVFKNMPTDPMITFNDVNNALPQMVASQYDRKIALKTEDVYLNEKIPFAYDYADKDEDVAPFESEHGTHVAGIIAGKDEKITGVATNTQLVLMKVFGDISTGATDEDIIAALEDSVKLGVDAINLSLGTACGFTVTSKNPLREVYQKIEDNGISLICAASNDYSSGYGGEQGNTSMATNPDSAAVGSPSTFNSSLAVASISGVKSKYIKSKDGFTFFFDEASGNGSSNYDFYKMLGIPENKDTEIEYVTVPGVGKPNNYTSIDIKGKIALVKRGGISFEEKALYAYEAGARGVILYNNVGGQILMNAGQDLKIAYASLSKDDGERLAAKKSGTLVFNTEFKAGPFMSGFSSWGPSPDLKLKPEITAHGGEILSSVPGGGYDRISGTSMASPNMCGIVVLIRQYLKEKFPSLQSDPKTLTNVTNQILMSTATIANDQYGNPYSPRKQGAGLGSLTNALNTDAFIVVNDEKTNELKTKTKIELYDDPKQKGEYELKFSIINISNKELRYELGNLTMTESLQTSDKRFIAEKARMLDPQSSFTVAGDGSKNGNVITVNANGHCEVTMKLKLNEADKRYMRQGFKNGIYVEGFATLTNKDAAGVDLSVPFLAFFGDWTKAPMLDKTIFEVESEKYNAAIDEDKKLKADYYATQPLGTFYTDFIIPLGSYIYDLDKTMYQPIPTSEDHCAIGYELTNINGILTVYAGLLRNAKKVTTTIKNAETGDIVYEHVNYDQLKAHFSGMVIPSFDMINVTAYGLGLENNVKYTFTMNTELDYGDGGIANNERNEFEFSFYCDSQAPILKDAQFYTKYDKTRKENRYYVDLMVYDNHYAQSVRPFALVDGNVQILSEYPIPVIGDRNGTAKVTVEVTDYLDLLQYNVNEDGSMKLTNGLGFLIDDYALNSSYYYVSLPGTNATELDFVDENGKVLNEISAKLGEELDLTKMLKTNDPTFNKDDLGAYEFLSKLNWESSDESVLRVKNGKIEGIKVGTAELTVSTVANDGMLHLKTITVKVRRGSSKNLTAMPMALKDEAEPIKDTPNKIFDNNAKFKSVDFTYFETIKAFPDGPAYSKIGKPGDFIMVPNMPTVEFYPSEQIKMNYEIKPWNLDPSRVELIWQSSNDSIATVDDNGLITAQKEGVATITLRVKVDGKMSNQMAKIRLKVNSEFIIQNRFLTGYKGFGGDVVIPDDKGILGIDSYAFSLYTLDVMVDVPEDDPDMNKLPGANLDIKSVVVPSDVTEIGKYAFYGCKNLEKVVLLSKQNGDKLETCKTIRQHAFDGCESLSDINLENVTVIAYNAFRNCKSLTKLNFSKIYSIGYNAFENCTGLTELDLTTLRNTGKEAFKGCTNLKKIKTGEFTKYSDGMFENSGLEVVDFYSDRIPGNAFKGCLNLKTVTIYNPIIYIGEGAFSNTKALENVVILKGCDFIYDNAFLNSNVNTITLPNSSVSFDNKVFAGCNNLTKLIFQEKTFISSALGGMLSGNDKVSIEIKGESANYLVNDSILYNKDKTEIILAPHNLKGSFIIPDGVVRIADGAFNSIPGLTEVVLNSSISYIGSYAFEGCSNLLKVSGDATKTEFGTGAFENCEKLESFEGIERLNRIYPAMFKNTGFKEVVINAHTIDDEAFMRSIYLTSVSGSIESIGKSAFEACVKLATVKLTGLENVNERAFYNCILLKSIDTASIITIGDYAFYGNTTLASLSLPAATHIGAYAFVNTKNLTSTLDLPAVTYIGAYAFTTDAKNATRANFVEGVNMPAIEEIGAHAFELNTKLTSITSNSEIRSIGEYAFASCTLLANISFPNSAMTEINEGVFFEDTSLKEANIKGIELIHNGAFYKTKSLKSFDFSKVKEIGMEAFAYNESLEEAIMPSLVKVMPNAFILSTKLSVVEAPVVEYIMQGAFSELAIKEFVIPSTIKMVGETAFNNNKMQTSFKTASGLEDGIINDYARLDKGVLYTTAANKKLILNSYPTGKKDTEYTVLENTVRIEFAAAAYNSNIEKLVLPQTLELIGNLAFYWCLRLKTVEFRSEVAPILEETIVNVELKYVPGTAIYDFVNKYFNLNDKRPLFYAQFKDFVGTQKGINIILPNEKLNIKGYDGDLYRLFFNLDDATRTDFVSLDQNVLLFLDLIDLVPTDNITLHDEKIIFEARTAYNKVKTYINDYEQIDKDALAKKLANLDRVEALVKNLHQAKIDSEYVDLIEDIKNLGSEFDYNKIPEFKRITELLDLVSESDKKYLDLTGYEAFKDANKKYFDELFEDSTTMDTITELPTTPVKIERTVVTALTVVMACVNVLGLALGKRWLI